MRGKVTVKKPSVAKRMLGSFFGDSLSSAWDYVLHDVLIPAAKSMFEGAINTGVHRVLHGNSDSYYPGAPFDRRGGQTYIRYGSMFNAASPVGGISVAPVTPMDRSQRARHDFSSITFEHRGDAEAVLQELHEQCLEYGVATVADFYAFCGVTPEHTDYRYGWQTMAGSSVTPWRGAFIIRLTRPIPVE